jgi:hypothetical protein
MAYSKEQYREYLAKIRTRRRAQAVELLGGRCSKCGATGKLEFHHIDRTSKRTNVGMMLHYSTESLSAELRKCVLLCSLCHHLESNNERGIAPLAHGSYGMYRGRKCRCALCRAANAGYTAQYRAKFGRKNRRNASIAEKEECRSDNGPDCYSEAEVKLAGV